jgi:acetylornithine deacetylase/succinyl-diaminopimelate desuccinylase-like protein
MRAAEDELVTGKGARLPNLSRLTAYLMMLPVLLVMPSGWSKSALGQATGLSAEQRLAREIFQELIEINTTHSTGDTTRAAEAMAVRLRSAGYAESDVQVIGPGPRNRNLVARLHGTGRRPPILFLAHLDVVEARPEDWSMDPFKLNERDGFFYGRGTSDIKDGAAILVADFIRMKQDGFKPDRDLIVALTAGEESGEDYNGVQWLLANRRELIDASYSINMDAGDPQIKNGKRVLRTVQATEKVYIDFNLEVRNPGGHSSLPTKDNAIYRLAQGLGRLARFDFPVRLNEVTRSYFRRMSDIVKDQPVAAAMKSLASNPRDATAASGLSEDPYYNAMMRTTCVATMLAGGHAPNALPQLARANVNCRMLPDDSPAEIEQTLIKVLADDQIKVSVASEPLLSPPSPLSPEVMGATERTTASLWPGVPVIPVMETGATDGARLRNAGIPTYGISGVFIDVDDVRAHGKDERIGVREYYDGVEYTYQLMKALASNN